MCCFLPAITTTAAAFLLESPPPRALRSRLPLDAVTAWVEVDAKINTNPPPGYRPSLCGGCFIRTTRRQLCPPKRGHVCRNIPGSFSDGRCRDRDGGGRGETGYLRRSYGAHNGGQVKYDQSSYVQHNACCCSVLLYASRVRRTGAVWCLSRIMCVFLTNG